MTTKHTPGPWIGKVDGVYPETDWNADHEHASTSSWVAINAPNGSTIALATITGWNDEKLEANARLIAAAPDLLEALKAAIARQAYRPGEGPDWWEQARVAIDKAIGVQIDVSI